MSDNYQIGSVVFNNWTIRRKIGEGSFGRVYEIQREDFGETYRAALKIITVPQNEAELQGVLEEDMSTQQAEQYFYGMVEDIVREFAIMSKLKGTANVVGYEDHAVIKHKGSIGWDILIRMELLNPLLSYAYEHPFARRDIIRLGIDICRALELCQKYNVIHRDIKPENIFVSDNGDFKLGDFGIARTIEKTMSGLSKKGTYNYMAPEVYRGGEYGFSVDMYSLGIVLYRLLNKNRIPFLPPAPEPITFKSREFALARRVSGEELPSPFYAEGRLAEIIKKACAFEPKDRYSSPAQMRQELEAILYEAEDSELIYPDGDELVLVENQYVGRTQDTEKHSDTHKSVEEDGTEAFFGNKKSLEKDDTYGSKTEAFFGSDQDQNENTSKTESIFQYQQEKKAEIRKETKKESKQKTSTESKSGKSKLVIVGGLVIALAAAGAFVYTSNQKKQEELQRIEAEYHTLLEEGSQLCESDPEEAMQKLLAAQQIHPEESAGKVSYAYALYCAGDYETCISYIENDLALGKQFDISVQNQLSEILGAAYFETQEYAAAASFFRFSTAGGDITVNAMRDYAVSLGKLGDFDAADEVLAKMKEAGADDLVTDYVQAEVDFAKQEYQAAENGFQRVLSNADDAALQKRAMRSLAEVYRDCAVLDRADKSPVYGPAEKAIALLEDGIAKFGLNYDSTLWEMLAMAYFESYEASDGTKESLTKAAECFNKVLDLGMQKDYIYGNLYSIYYELEQFDDAESALKQYEEAFPKDYMPHALRGVMLITMENTKPQEARDYGPAIEEYQTAGQMMRSSDDATYYQQLESLIRQLRDGGWIS